MNCVSCGAENYAVQLNEKGKKIFACASCEAVQPVVDEERVGIELGSTESRVPDRVFRIDSEAPAPPPPRPTDSPRPSLPASPAPRSNGHGSPPDVLKMLVERLSWLEGEIALRASYEAEAKVLRKMMGFAGKIALAAPKPEAKASRQRVKLEDAFVETTSEATEEPLEARRKMAALKQMTNGFKSPSES